jgi:hypothetical protein
VVLRGAVLFGVLAGRRGHLVRVAVEFIPRRASISGWMAVRGSSAGGTVGSSSRSPPTGEGLLAFPRGRRAGKMRALPMKTGLLVIDETQEIIERWIPSTPGATSSNAS